MEGIPGFDDPRLLVGTETSDDAGVYQISEDTALVQTVDVFTPVVDDAYTFGQIVASNSMSDVWAMGGRVLSVLNLLGYPPAKLPAEDAGRLLRGIGDKVREAGAVVCGGHTWVDPEIRSGLAVTGVVHPRCIMTNAGAKPGDTLILTKPIGAGIITYAATQGKATDDILRRAVESMVSLNQVASEVMVEIGAHACTDVTGFSLMGHAVEMAQASRVGMEMNASRIPVFAGAADLARDGFILPLGDENAKSFGPNIRFNENVPELTRRLLFDPQTSGGLLIAADMRKEGELLERLHVLGVEHAAAIGRITEEESGTLTVSP